MSVIITAKKIRYASWWLAVLLVLAFVYSWGARNGSTPAKNTTTTKQTSPTKPMSASKHIPVREISLDEALDIAVKMQKGVQASVHDYSSILVSKERIKGTVLTRKMFAKICNPRTESGTTIPLSIYLRFIEPANVKGREVLYVEGQHGGWLRAHEVGNLGIATFELNPTGPWAMRDNLHPITDTGILRLLEQLIEKGKAARKCPREEFQVTLGESEIDGHKCQSLQIVHKNHDHDFNFHIVRIDADNELNIPIHYAAYDWPLPPNEKPELIESYTYTELKLNVGSKAEDFQYDNSAYSFPKRVIREDSLVFRSLGFLEKFLD